VMSSWPSSILPSSSFEHLSPSRRHPDISSPQELPIAEAGFADNTETLLYDEQEIVPEHPMVLLDADETILDDILSDALQGTIDTTEMDLEAMPVTSIWMPPVSSYRFRST
jgi:hypothetical protein